MIIFFILLFFDLSKGPLIKNSLEIILERENQPFKFHHSNAKIEVQRYAKIQIARHLRENFSVRKHARTALKMLIEYFELKNNLK